MESGSAKVVRVLIFLLESWGVNGVMRFLVLQPVSSDGKQQFIPPLTPISLMRQLCANIRVRESGDVLELVDDRGKIHTEKKTGQRAVGTRAQPTGFFLERWLELATRSLCSVETRSGHCRQPPLKVKITESTIFKSETRAHIRVLWFGGPGNRQHQ